MMALKQIFLKLERLTERQYQHVYDNYAIQVISLIRFKMRLLAN